MINPRSLRVRLSLWYILITMGWMSVIGAFSWIYLRRALASSRSHTMLRRERRLLLYMNDEWRNHPGLSLDQQFSHYLEADVETDVVQVFDLDGNRIYPASGRYPAIAWPGGSFCIDACFGEIHLNNHRMRTLNHIVLLNGRPVRLCLAGTVDEHYDILNNILECYLIVFPVMLFACIFGGYILSRRALLPVDRITRDARIIGIHDLKSRLPVLDTGDELQRLTETWNELLARLDTAVSRLTQFTSDISHDLRTSTSVILATAQVALRRQRSPEDYRGALTTIALECQSTSSLLADLLTIARAEVAQPQIVRTPVNLAEVLEEVCEQMHAQALLREQQLSHLGPCEAWVCGDLSMLRRLIAILIDNALRYTPEHGIITASVAVQESTIRLDVQDTGIGIAPEDADRIFDRFFRVDPVRGREHGGNGLGLTIARWIADAHAGTISVSSSPGRGSLFTVCLPRQRYTRVQAEHLVSA